MSVINCDRPRENHAYFNPEIQAKIPYSAKFSRVLIFAVFAVKPCPQKPLTTPLANAFLKIAG